MDNRDINVHLSKLESLLAGPERFNSISSVPIRTERFYEALPFLTLGAKGDFNIYDRCQFIQTGIDF